MTISFNFQKLLVFSMCSSECAVHEVRHKISCAGAKKQSNRIYKFQVVATGISLCSSLNLFSIYLYLDQQNIFIHFRDIKLAIEYFG